MLKKGPLQVASVMRHNSIPLITACLDELAQDGIVAIDLRAGKESAAIERALYLSWPACLSERGQCMDGIVAIDLRAGKECAGTPEFQGTCELR